VVGSCDELWDDVVGCEDCAPVVVLPCAAVLLLMSPLCEDVADGAPDEDAADVEPMASGFEADGLAPVASFRLPEFEPLIDDASSVMWRRTS